MIPNDPISQEIFATPSYPYFEDEIHVKPRSKKTKSPDLFNFDLSQSKKGEQKIVKLPTKQLENLEKEQQAIENLVGFATSLKSDTVKSIQARVDEISDEVIGRIVNDLHTENKLEALVIEEVFIRQNPIAEAVVVGVNIASRGLVVFAAGVLLAKIKETLAAKEASLPNMPNDEQKKKLEKEIKTLKNWVELQSNTFSGLIKDVFINSIFSLPKAGSAIMTLSNATEMIATSVAEFTFLGIGVISCAFSLHAADSNFDKHELWVKTMQNIGNSREEVSTIIEKGVALKNAKDQALKDLVESVISELKNIDPSKEALDEVVKKLEAKGITINEIIKGKDPLEDAKNLIHYLENPGNEKILKQMMAERQTLSASTRDQLKRLNNKKIEVNRGFLNFDLYKSVTVFSVTAVVTTLTVILEVLMLVGAVASVAVVGAVLGYGMLALVFGFMIFGAIYYYVKRPNVFKTYLNGVQSQLFLLKIPLAIQNYRKNYMLMEEIQISHNITVLANRALELNKINDDPNDRRSYFNSHTEEIKQVLANGALEGIVIYNQYLKTKKRRNLADDDIGKILSAYKRELRNQEEAKLLEVKSYVDKLKELGDSIDYFEKEIKPLQAQVEEAGWKDFLHNLHKDRPQNEKEITEENAVPLETIKTKTPKDEVEIIAENLVKEAASSLDNETRKLLQHMDIDFKISPTKAEKATKKIAKQLRLFFSMGPEETLSMIEKVNQNSG